MNGRGGAIEFELLSLLESPVARPRDYEAFPELKGLHIHEIHPVKFNGSPTDLGNKMIVTPAEHYELNTFWNRAMRSMEK